MKFHTFAIKVQLFWEGHKNLCILPRGLDISLVNVQTIVQVFVAFSEKLNFTQGQWAKKINSSEPSLSMFELKICKGCPEAKI